MDLFEPEKLFNLVQINPSEFSRFFRTHKNIIFVGKIIKILTLKINVKSQIVMYINSNSNEHDFKTSCKIFQFP